MNELADGNSGEGLGEIEYALLIITSDADGNSSIKFEFSVPEGLASRLEERRKVDHESLAEPSKPLKPFRREARSDDLISKELGALSRKWASVAIGFFEIIPKFAEQNREYVEKEMADKVIAIADSVAANLQETVGDDGTVSREYRLQLRDVALVAKGMGKNIRGFESAQIIAKSALGALISEYDAFLTNLLRAVCRLHPSMLIPDEEAVPVSKIENYSSFSELLDDLIDEKIEDLIQSRSHLQLLKWIEQRFGLNLTSDEQIITEFVEICQRRHLLAHAGGMVNKKYLKICAEHGWKEGDLPKIGEEVEVSRKYLRRATARVFLVGFFTLHILWQKLIPKDRERSLQAILETSHDFLDHDLTKMCERLCEFCLNSNRDIPWKTRAYFVINLAQSSLFDPDLDDEFRARKVESVLRRHDWSLTSPMVDLALACVRRDFSNLKLLTERALQDELTYNNAMTWSIFREVRDMPDFREMVQKQA